MGSVPSGALLLRDHGRPVETQSGTRPMMGEAEDLPPFTTFKP